MPIALIIDTSKYTSLLALCEDEKILHWNLHQHEGQLSKYYLISIQEMLGDTIPDYIAVGTGPGLFTGTRIGVAIGKSLSYAWQIPLVPFSSPLAFEEDARTLLPKHIAQKFSSSEYSLTSEVNLIY